MEFGGYTLDVQHAAKRAFVYVWHRRVMVDHFEFDAHSEEDARKGAAFLFEKWLKAEAMAVREALRAVRAAR